MTGRGMRRGNRSNLQANQEKRNGKILQAFREVDSSDSGAINGALFEAVRNEKLPPFNNFPNHRTAFLLNPQQMDRRFNHGLVTGFAIGMEIARSRLAEKGLREDVSIDDVQVGRIWVDERSRKVVLAELLHEQLFAERRAIYQGLGNAGVHGFIGDSSRRGRHIAPPTIEIGTLRVPLSPTDVEPLVAGIEEVFAIRELTHVSLGCLTVKAYQP